MSKVLTEVALAVAVIAISVKVTIDTLAPVIPLLLIGVAGVVVWRWWVRRSLW